MQSPDCYASSFPISSFLDTMKLNPHFRTSLCPYRPPLVIPHTPNQPPHPIFLIIFRYFGALESGCVLTNPTCYPPNPVPTRHPISSQSYQGSLPDSQDCAALFFQRRIFSILQHPSQCHNATPITMSDVYFLPCLSAHLRVSVTS